MAELEIQKSRQLRKRYEAIRGDFNISQMETWPYFYFLFSEAKNGFGQQPVKGAPSLADPTIPLIVDKY